MSQKNDPPILEPLLPEGEKAVVRYRRSDKSRLLSLIFALGIILFSVLLSLLVLHAKAGEPPESDAAATTAGDSESNASSLSATGQGDPPETAVPSDLYAFNPPALKGGECAIRPLDLTHPETLFQNQTSYSPDPGALREAAKAFASGSNAASTGTVAEGLPLVLILHTHTSEAYSPSGAAVWNGTGELARSRTPTENVVAVGAVLAEVLREHGIPTIHVTIQHDTANGAGSYSGSYERAAETIASYLSTYPSIRYVIDLHRDAVLDKDGNIVRAVTEVDGEAVAQVMAVVGSDENGTDCPWQSNLVLAAALSDGLNQINPALCRPASLRSASYNQEFAAYSLLLEIGCAGNSLDEAKAAAKLVGAVLAELIRKNEGA